jgi:homoserine dehydrogenase
VEEDIVVLKFGSSVLRTPEDLPSAVHEIYRWYRQGYRVIAVVSAIGETTNQLLAAGTSLTECPEPYALGELLATGERESAALLGIALDRVGVRTRVVDPREIGLVALGSVLDSEPVNVDHEKLISFLSQTAVLVVPGFFGFDEKKRLHLLGRGGSDLTAAFLSHTVNATRFRLIKDVDGVYETDPATAMARRPRRYATLTRAQALASAGRLIQPKALDYLDRHQRTAEVAALGCGYETYVGPPVTTVADAVEASPTRVLLLGLGTVGGGTYQRLAAMPEHFQVVGALVRSTSRYSAEGIPAALLHSDTSHLQHLDCDVVVDALPGVKLSSQLGAAFLARGINVITANKAVIAQSGAELRALAAQHNAHLRYSAAVGGSAPMIEAVGRMAQCGGIVSLAAVLNGTCNFVLEQCERGVPLDEAVRDARQRGFAETDDSEDLSGRDSGRKLQILARHAFGRDVDSITVNGLGEHDLKRVMATTRNINRARLIGTAELVNGCVLARVGLECIGVNHALANVHGEWNALAITLANGDIKLVTGRGAGRWPTTEAVIADLFELRRVQVGTRNRRGERSGMKNDVVLTIS